MTTMTTDPDVRDRMITTLTAATTDPRATPAELVDELLALPELQPLASATAAKVYGHPCRRRIINLLGQHARLSPAGMLLWEQQWTLGTVAYHFRTLARLGVIKEVATRQRRGAIEHLYALTEETR